MKVKNRFILSCAIVEVREVIRDTKTIIDPDTKKAKMVEQEHRGWVAVLDTHYVIPLGKNKPEIQPGPCRLVLEVDG